jgi:hypothetical protein
MAFQVPTATPILVQFAHRLCNLFWRWEHFVIQHKEKSGTLCALWDGDKPTHQSCMLVGQAIYLKVDWIILPLSAHSTYNCRIAMCSLSLYQCAVRQCFVILHGLSIVSKKLISHDTDNSVFSRKESTGSTHERSFFLVTHDASR